MERRRKRNVVSLASSVTVVTIKKAERKLKTVFVARHFSFYIGHFVPSRIRTFPVAGSKSDNGNRDGTT